MTPQVADLLEVAGGLAPAHFALAGGAIDELVGHFDDRRNASAPIVDEQLKVMGRCNLTPRLAELAGIPTLVASGRHDPIAPPAFGRAIAAGIPGSRYVEFEDASHAVTIQQADRVNALLLEHLDAACPTPSAAPRGR